MPREPEAFAEKVVEMLRRLHDELHVELTGPSEAIVDGRRLDLDNLYRLVAHSEDSGVEVVEEYLSHLFGEDAQNIDAIPLELAKRIVMPRIHHVSIFDRLVKEMVAHEPYVNDTVILYVLDLPQMTVSVTTEQMVRWGLTTDDLDTLARKNLAELAPDFEVQYSDTTEGGTVAVINHQDGYDASRVLLGHLFGNLAPVMGGDFLVALPSRDTFVALTRDPDDFVSRMHDRVARDFKRLPYPITDDYFYVTRDGVAGTKIAA